LAADKDSGIDDKNSIKNQVTILKKLQACECILKYFGLTAEDRLKLRLALDIARGLNFLRTVSIVRAENILITIHEAAKIANFKSSRSVSERTRNQKVTLEFVRYCAPEILLNGEKHKYDTKCEVYSFEQVCIKNYREPFSHSSFLPSEYQELSINAVHYDHKFRPQFSKIFTILQDLKKKGCGPPPVPNRLDTSDSNSLKLSDEEVNKL
ncbi:9145_t:CDS:2, partial [Funneliformis geosporum]